VTLAANIIPISLRYKKNKRRKAYGVKGLDLRAGVWKVWSMVFTLRTQPC